MKEYKVAVLGATGAVGREMIKILEERNFPISELLPLASEKSAGTRIVFRKKETAVKAVNENSFRGCDIVLGAAPNHLAVKFAPYITGAGAVFIDNSSAFRLDDGVPLVIPEINPDDVRSHSGIIANPNCATIIALVAVNPINKLSKITKMTVSTYQAVSGAGAGGITELLEQTAAVSENKTVAPAVFPYRIAYNLIPQIGAFLENGYTAEEMKMQNEGRKIMHSPSLKVSCTCVRVPVIRSHSESIAVTTESPVTPDDARKAISASCGCAVCDDTQKLSYPMPITAQNGDDVLVGRIRTDIAEKSTLDLWCVGDQLRKGAATNAVQIAETLIRS